MNKIEITNKIIDNGFEVNVYGDAYYKDCYCIFFDDTDIHVIKWNNPINQATEWNSSIDGNMGPDKVISVIESMIS